jgi:hypothetical protein
MCGRIMIEGKSQISLDGSFQLFLGLLENDGVLDAFYELNGGSTAGVANLAEITDGYRSNLLSPLDLADSDAYLVSVFAKPPLYY